MQQTYIKEYDSLITTYILIKLDDLIYEDLLTKYDNLSSIELSNAAIINNNGTFKILHKPNVYVYLGFT